MYTKAIRDFKLQAYSHVKSTLSRFVRNQYPHDPLKPKIVTKFPGAAHMAQIEAMQSPVYSEVDYYEKMQRFINFKQSKGNYFRDTDGNTVLDLNAKQSGLVLGYNNDGLALVRDTELYDRFVTHKVHASQLPTHDFADLVRENVMKAAPPGCTQVFFSGGQTGADANEAALATALKHHAMAHGISDMSQLVAIGFDNSNHGQTTGCLSVSSADANPNKLPAFPWPKAEYPQLKYPLYAHEAENAAEEERCLDGVKQLFATNKVAAIIVEPISSLGNQMATPTFYKKLRKLAKAEGVCFIVDETKTGMGASGKNWAHEYWYLHDDQTPDIVTFGGNGNLNGFYSNLSQRLEDQDNISAASQSFQQQIDMVKLLTYGQTWKVIEDQDLLHFQKDTSSFLKIELNNVAEDSGLISNVRGYGTHLGFDVADPLTANSLQSWLFKSGIHLLKCGPTTFGLRPSLVMGVQEGAKLRQALQWYHPNHE